MALLGEYADLVTTTEWNDSGQNEVRICQMYKLNSARDRHVVLNHDELRNLIRWLREVQPALFD